jgi:hypothetical protein
MFAQRASTETSKAFQAAARKVEEAAFSSSSDFKSSVFPPLEP